MDKLTEQYFRAAISEIKEKLEEKRLLNEERQQLQEMAVIGKECSGFRMIVKSNDSASKTEPAHVSIQETNSHKIIGKVFLNTEKAPNTVAEIKSEPEKIKKPFDKDEFLKWAKSKYRNTNITNWEQAINSYNDQLEAYRPCQI